MISYHVRRVDPVRPRSGQNYRLTLGERASAPCSLIDVKYQVFGTAVDIEMVRIGATPGAVAFGWNKVAREWNTHDPPEIDAKTIGYWRRGDRIPRDLHRAKVLEEALRRLAREHGRPPLDLDQITTAWRSEMATRTVSTEASADDVAAVHAYAVVRFLDLINEGWPPDCVDMRAGENAGRFHDSASRFADHRFRLSYCHVRSEAIANPPSVLGFDGSGVVVDVEWIDESGIRRAAPAVLPVAWTQELIHHSNGPRVRPLLLATEGEIKAIPDPWCSRHGVPFALVVSTTAVGGGAPGEPAVRDVLWTLQRALNNMRSELEIGGTFADVGCATGSTMSSEILATIGRLSPDWYLSMTRGEKGVEDLGAWALLIANHVRHILGHANGASPEAINDCVEAIGCDGMAALTIVHNGW